MENIELWNTLGSLTEIENSRLGIDGTNNLAVSSYEAGKWLNCINIPASRGGATQFVKFASYPLSTEGCMEAWVKPDGWSWDGTNASDATQHHLFTYSAYSGHSIYWNFDHTQSAYFDIGGTGGVRLSATNIILTAGTWTHLAISWSKTSGWMKSYQDGAETDTANNTIPIVITDTLDISLGFESAQTNFGWKGCIDNYKVWSRAKTDFTDRLIEGFGGAKRRISTCRT